MKSPVNGNERAISNAEKFVGACAAGIIFADHKGVITYWNDMATRTFGFTSEEMVGSPIELIMPERFRAAHAAGMKRIRGGDSPLAGKTVDLVGLHKQGHEFPIALSLTSWEDSSGRQFGAQVKDISDRKHRETELEHRATHDHLTGLLNRAEFSEQLNISIAEYGGATVLVADLDGFKAVNDTLGHCVGDTLLQTFALRLTGALQEGAVGARLGGDEFAILIPCADDLLTAQAIAKNLLQIAASPFPLSGYDIPVRCSVGIAASPMHTSHADELIMRADMALFQAKKEGGSRYRLFDNGLSNMLHAERELKDALLKATQHNEWQLLYQPQYTLDDGCLVGAEALLRWNHPTAGLQSPASFLSTLEKHLVALDVGRWVLDEACRQLAEWRADGLNIPRVSVNLFASQFQNDTLIHDINATLHAYQLSPTDLEIEITEKIALAADDTATASLRTLNQMGVSIAFDDFGTGFASLTSIKELPLTRLKIDRSFVRDLIDDPHSEAIIRAINLMGEALGLDVIAEGIETPVQHARLRQIGCRFGQGYLMGKPMIGAQFCSAHQLKIRSAI